MFPAAVSRTQTAVAAVSEEKLTFLHIKIRSCFLSEL